MKDLFTLTLWHFSSTYKSFQYHFSNNDILHMKIFLVFTFLVSCLEETDVDVEVDIEDLKGLKVVNLGSIRGP